MEIKKSEIISYVAFDGTEFEKESECEKYEMYSKLNEEERYPRLSRKLTNLIQTLDGFDGFKVEIGKQKFHLYKDGKRIWEIYNLIKYSEFKEKFLNVAYVKYGFVPEGTAIWTMFSTR